MKKNIYQEAFGIATGDHVRTSYNTGPYEVWDIGAPHYYSGSAMTTYIIRDWPVISLTLIKPGDARKVHEDYSFSYINSIRQEGNRWFTDQNDEIFVVKMNNSLAQMDMFRSSFPTPQTYPFQPGVDYTPGRVRWIWKREGCKLDFNFDTGSYVGPANCPKCGWFSQRIIVMPSREIDRTSEAIWNLRT